METLRSTLCVTLIVTFISSGFCCTEDEWRCASGECISVYDQCNGKIDCKDESDETAESCLQEVCPTSSYRCAYGACVSANALCNGIRECADGSDEATVLCDTNRPTSTKCVNEEEFQCDTGECIDHDKACDGNSDCPDQSDETVEQCANSCPSWIDGFRCGYGACIAKDKICDGKPDCRDGSDETVSLCGGRPIGPTTTTIKTPGSTSRPPTTTKPPPVPGCKAPVISNSILVIEADQKQILPGEKVPDRLSIEYKCKRDHIRVGIRFNLCFNSVWKNNPDPQCIKFCKPLDGVTFRTECEFAGAAVPCNDRILPKTKAVVFCRERYRKPSHNPTDVLWCQNDGEWDYPPFRCEPICGEELPKVQAFILNASPTNITEVPWHVGIYFNPRLDGNYVHSCGGTIINAKVVISAAHCFWDFANEKVYTSTLYLVGAGKYYRDYHTREVNAQFQNISSITIPSGLFKADTHNYQGDIAILVLTNYLTFNSYIAPVCIEWKDKAEQAITTNTYGRVAGWGIDENAVASVELRAADMPATSYSDCKKEAGALSSAITTDKFCVFNKNSEIVCSGDSGGGFTEKRFQGGKNVFYLWGVVSGGVPAGRKCREFDFVSFTNIQYFRALIEDLEGQNRVK